jgi:hypothetical protein
MTIPCRRFLRGFRDALGPPGKGEGSCCLSLSMSLLSIRKLSDFYMRDNSTGLQCISISVRGDNCSHKLVEGRNFFGRKAIAFLDDANDELILSSDD